MKPTIKHSNPKLLPIGFALGLGTVLLIAAALTWFPEGDRPLQSDNSQKSLQKINDLLYGGGAGLTVQATFAGTVNTDTNANLYSYGSPGSTTTITDGNPFPVKDTNQWNFTTNEFRKLGDTNTLILTELALIRQAQTNNPSTNNVHITDTTTGTTEANAVIVTNQYLVQIASFANSISNSANQISNKLAGTLTVAPTPGSNQVSFGYTATNLVNNSAVNSARTVGYVAWACTNSAVTTAGDDALLCTINLTANTNQDFIIKAYSQVVDAPTIDASPNISRANRQYRIGMWSTGTLGNTNYSSGWVLDGTNYLCTLSGLACPFKSGDGKVMFIATYADTKTNYTASDTLFSAGYLKSKP